MFQTNKGYKFESETDTEVVIKLVKYLYDKHKTENITFQKLIEMACSQLVKDEEFLEKERFRLILVSRKAHSHFYLKVFIFQANCVQHGRFRTLTNLMR